MKAKELIKMLENDGWYQVRQSGSHRIFKHPTKDASIPVPDHGNKDLKIGTLNFILKLAGLK